jgi:hypothetical protein
VAAATGELSIDWFELTVKVFENKRQMTLLMILKNDRNRNGIYIIVVLPMYKSPMGLNRRKVNAL